jgi:hypothetical protein
MDEFYPKAVIWPGPENKQGYGSLRTRIAKGLVAHSAEGYLPGALGRLESTDQASWHGTIDVTGVVYQHYPLSACCWDAGSEYPNIRWAGWEFIGRAGEPLTQQQVASGIDLFIWQAEQEEWPDVLLQKDTGTLHEHNWYFPTACPSGRIPWDRIIGGINMALVSKAEFDAYKNMVGLQQFGRDLRDGLITDLLSGKYHVGMKPNLTRVLILPSGAEVPID